MTSVTINSKNFDYQKDVTTTVGEMINLLLENDLCHGQSITEVRLDQTILDLHTLKNQNEHFILTSKIEKYEEIDFITKTSLALALEALDSCDEYLIVLAGKISTLLTLYREDKHDEGNRLFTEFLEIMDLFTQLMNQINHAIKTNSPDEYQKPESVTNLENELLYILKTLIPAKEKNDIVMLCDLLEYELMDNLNKWKIMAIPELKKAKNN